MVEIMSIGYQCTFKNRVWPPHRSLLTYDDVLYLSWNSLMSALRDPALTIDMFRRKLKTELFVV